MGDTYGASADASDGHWSGVSVRVRRWRPKASDILITETPTLHILLDEVAGRCELHVASHPVELSYFGVGSLSFAPAHVPVALHPLRALEVKIASFEFQIDEIAQVSAASGRVLVTAPARAMFDDERLRECLSMLASECETPRNTPEFGEGLAQSAIAAATSVLAEPQSSSGPRLTHRQFGLVSERMELSVGEPVVLHDLAAVAGLAPQDFMAAFQQATGVSPQQWQMRTRIRHAQRLMLDDAPRSLTEIAARLRFADQSHLSRLFKQFTGSSPRDWLRQRS